MEAPLETCKLTLDWFIMMPCMEVCLEAGEAHPEALETHPGALESHSGAMEAHPGAVEAGG